MAVVALSMSDTFIHSLSVARDVAASKVSQQQFRIALQKMLSDTRYSVCYLYDRTDVNDKFPYIINSAAAPMLGIFYGKRANLDSTVEANTLQVPLSLKKESVDIVQGKGAPSRVDFLFLSEIPYSEGLSPSTVSRLAIGRLVIDNAIDLSNKYKYSYVKLYKGTGRINGSLQSQTLDDALLVSSYRIRLRDDVELGAFINYITYWPHLQLYTVPLPSNLSYLAEASKTQLNVYRYGVFNPDIITLP